MVDFDKELGQLEDHLKKMVVNNLTSESRRFVETLLEQVQEHRDGKTTKFSSGVKLFNPMIDEEEQNFLMADDDLLNCKPYIF